MVVSPSEIAAKLGQLCAGLSPEQEKVLRLVGQGKNVFCTGCGGTGKSYLSKGITDYLTFVSKKYIVTATTGIASLNVGGCTIHRYSGMGIRSYDDIKVEMKKIRFRKGKEWAGLQVLIIDEVSMLSRDAFEDLCYIAQELRNNRRDPMGGLQIIFFGDFFQLGPIFKKGSTDTHCFKSQLWPKVFPPAQCVELTHIFRQNDPEFKAHLNNVRVGNVTDETDAFFRALDRDVETPAGIKPTRLYCYNRNVDAENKRWIDEIASEEHTFDALDIQDPAPPPPPPEDKITSPYFKKEAVPAQTSRRLTPEEIDQRLLAKRQLVLKRGAQVMMLKNHLADMGIVNGSTGVVVGFMDDPDIPAEWIQQAALAGITDQKARLLGSCPVVRFVNKKKEETVQIVYAMDFEVRDGSQLVATRSQVPLVVSYATTIHKSQGMSIQHLEVIFGQGGQGTFECGQAYVALSRAISKDTMCVRNFRPSLVMIDLEVVAFYRQFGNVFDPTASEGSNNKNKRKPEDDGPQKKRPTRH